jgi:hypothetical protein
MASYEEVAQAVLEAIRASAVASQTTGSAEALLARAKATRELAEAYAWLNSPGQPH